MMPIKGNVQTIVIKLTVSIITVLTGASALTFVYLWQLRVRLPESEMLPMLPVYGGILLINVVTGGFLCLIVWKQLQKWLVTPLSRLSACIQELRIQETRTISGREAEQCREIQLLSNASTTMLKHFEALLEQLHEADTKILEASEFIFTSSKHQSSLLASQSYSVDDTAKAVRELVVAVQQVSADIKAVVDVANSTLQLAEQGQEAVSTVARSMEDIRSSSQVSSNKIIALGKQSEHINEVVKTIDRIIEDTKLIAFNATIEAARAKDEGKGFGVVALEIKRLAEEVFESTEDIKELIQDIQQVSHALVLAAEDEMKTIYRGIQLTEDAGSALWQIVQMVKRTTESAQRIASAAQQQQGAGDHVLQAMDAANQAIDQFSRESKQLAMTAAELNILADGLGQIISGFGGKEYARRESHS